MREQIENYSLPDGWIWVSLSDVVINPKVDLVDGPFGSNLKSDDFTSEGIPVFKIQNIKAGYFLDKNIQYVTTEKALELERHSFKEGDIIITKLGEPLGLACKVPIKYPNGIIVADLIRLRPSRIVNVDYLVSIINSKIVQDQFKEITNGTTRSRVNLTLVRNIQIPLAPIEEQERINTTLETIYYELENSKNKLRDAQKKLKIYQEVLLKNAFEGKLTEQWRNHNQPDDSSLILKTIDQDRENYFKREIEVWNASVKHWESNKKLGRKPQKPQKQKKLDEFSDLELLEYPLLPPEWKWTKIDKLIEFSQHSIKAGPFGSALKKEVYVEKGYKVYGQEQAIANNAYIGDYYITKEKYEELLSCSVKPFDILISLVGTVGKVLILPEDAEKGIINPRLLKVSLNKKYYMPKIFQLFFESSFLKSLYSIHTHGATMDVLNLGIVQSLPFPLMSIKEQDQIVKELEFQFSKISDLDKIVSSGLAKLEMLRQTILKKAFDGKLVSQNTNDEPISNILEQIKIEKENYLAELKEQKKGAPKKIKKMSKNLTIEDVLKASDKPMNAREVWQLSKYKSNIEDFYKELKDIQEKVKVVTKGTDSLLTLVK